MKIAGNAGGGHGMFTAQHVATAEIMSMADFSGGDSSSRNAGGSGEGSGLDTAQAWRCPHTRSRWLVVALILVLWGGVSCALQFSDSVAERLRHTRTGEIISVRKGDDTAAIYNVRSLAVGEPRPRAAFVVLARLSDLDGVLMSMRGLERRLLNDTEARYPWIFLDNGELDEAFRNATSAATSSETRYGTIPKEQWSYPPWVSEQAAAASRLRMQHDGVLYGDRESYHFMCRYFSGFFHHHPLLADIDYYWRVEPEVHYYCDLPYDPFVKMQQQSIKYGFTLAVIERRDTIPTLWDATRDFMAANPHLLPKANLLDFVTSSDGNYNLCHMWSNFELGDLRFFRSKEYQAYFEYLDRLGGFFHERWGDAPVHSLAAAMLLNASEVHHFSEIGYRHNSMVNCPATKRYNCDCDAMTSVDQHALLNSFGRCHGLWSSLTATQESSVE